MTLLRSLFQRLESQTTLGVTYVPDLRSADDFHIQRYAELVIKAGEKRKHLQEAASVLKEIGTALERYVKKERTFYRELIGLSRFHSVFH